MSAGGWHLTDNELASDMTLKDVSMSNIGEVTKKSRKCSCVAIICAQCAAVIICSTAVQLGDSFTVAFPPSGQAHKRLQRAHAELQQQAAPPHVPVKRTLTSTDLFVPDQPCFGRTDTQTSHLSQNKQCKKPNKHLQVIKSTSIPSSDVLILRSLSAFSKHYHNLTFLGPDSFNSRVTLA